MYAPLHHQKKRMADGCQHVYVDMGSNVGHQIRKLYQPELYLGNPTEEIFQRFFGQGIDRNGVCAFGFEANPLHTRQLQSLESHLTGLRRRLRIFTSQAVSVADGPVRFYQDPGAKEHNQWGGSLHTDTLSDKENLTEVVVPAIEIAHWLQREVLQRKVPTGST